MATIGYGQVKSGRYSANSSASYKVLREELRMLPAGDTFVATFTGRYAARCARHALGHFCRHDLGYEITARQLHNVLEITRTK